MKKQIILITVLVANSFILADAPIKPIIDEARIKKIKEVGNEFYAYFADKEKTACLLSDREKLREASAFLDQEKIELTEKMIISAAECFGKGKGCAEFAFNQSLLIGFYIESLANTKSVYIDENNSEEILTKIESHQE